MIPSYNSTPTHQSTDITYIPLPWKEILLTWYAESQVEIIEIWEIVTGTDNSGAPVIIMEESVIILVTAIPEIADLGIVTRWNFIIAQSLTAELPCKLGNKTY